MSVKPARVWRQFSLCERGDLLNARVTALGSGLDRSILTDELKIFQDGLTCLMDFQPEDKVVDAEGSGNALFSELEYENITELFCVCGSYGVSRKTVANRVAGMTKQYLKKHWVVGKYLADQLLLPMALGAGGHFLTGKPTLHSVTNREVIRRFLNVDINFKPCDRELYEMEIVK